MTRRQRFFSIAAVLRLGRVTATILALTASSVSVAVEFRTIDGYGNNTLSTSQGAANTRVIRFGYDADYPDGIGDVIAEPGKPNPRDVSNIVNAQSVSTVNDRGLSDWVVQWGQFVTHDISLIPIGPSNNVLSNGAIGNFNIAINDPGDVLGPNPIAFNRSIYDAATGNGDVVMTQHGPVPIPRWQINANTSYLDASNIYGSDATTASELRTYSDGKLAASAGGLLPPLDAAGKFRAGDVRANENVSLSATHALFVREHNRLADLIKSHDGSLSDEAIYQWARKIVGAEVQAITYREFLPALIGVNAPAATDYVYDETVDVSITTAFSTAAFRFGHSMQSPEIKLVDNAGVDLGEIELSVAASPNSILRDDPAKVALVLKGLATQAAQENDAYVINDLRNILFGPPGAGGTDLAAVDIQRGRDHGLLNSYTFFRITYNLAPYSQFDQLTSDTVVQSALASIYGTIDNLDAWVAMISENHADGSSLGALAQTIVISQFERLRNGDRFFFTSDPDLQSSLVTSVIDLNSVTLGQLIKWNTGLTSLQENVFFAVDVIPEPSTSILLITGMLVACLSRGIRNSPTSKMSAYSYRSSRGAKMQHVFLSWRVPTMLLCTLCMTPRVQGHVDDEPDTGAGYHAFIDDFHANPSTTDATGEIHLSLNAARTELSYSIELDGLLGLKPNPADRTQPDDIIGIHLHLHVPDTVGPHVLNIFGLATYDVPAEEDDDLVINYEQNTLSGIWDNSDATIDPVTGEPYFQFFPLTSKLLTDWLEYLDNGELMVAIHTKESGFPTMAIHGHISPSIPEPATATLLMAGIAITYCSLRSRRSIRIPFTQSC